MPKAIAEKNEKKKGKTGRPKKFGRPTRAFYLALPEDVVERLRLVDPDLGTAIVKLVESTPFAALETGVEVSSVAPGNYLLWVSDIKALHNWDGIHLYPVEPGRHLLVCEAHYDARSFELDLRDRLEREESDSQDRAALEKLALILKELRSQGHVLAVPALCE